MVECGGGRYIEKSKIPKDSFFQKIYPFKEDSFNPLLYVKFIPFLVCCLIFIIVFFVYVIYWINPDLLVNFLQSKGCLYGSIGYTVIVALYTIFLKF